MFQSHTTQDHAAAETTVRIPDLDVTTETGKLIRGGIPTVIDGNRCR